MTKNQLITSDDANIAKCQHTKACSDCPWSRKSLSGWLGPYTSDEWVQIGHSDAVVPCHALKGVQCAGIAIYRTNVCKSARPPNLKLPKDKENVFGWCTEFKEHHDKLNVIEF